MDSQNAINILVAINLLVSMSANFSGARKGFKNFNNKSCRTPGLPSSKISSKHCRISSDIHNNFDF